MMLRDFFSSPTSFEGQPVGFAFNQFGHAGVGMLLAWLVGVWWPVAIGYAIWEYLQWKIYQAEKWDCVEDWSFVLLGAMSAFNLWLMVPLSGYVLAGYLRRLVNEVEE